MQSNTELKHDALTIVSEYAMQLMTMMDDQKIFWYLANEVITKLGFEEAVIYTKNGDKLIQRAATSNKIDKNQHITNLLILEVGQGVVGKAAKLQIPLNIKDTRKEPGYIVDDAERLSELAVPIIFEGEVLGVIDSEHSDTHFFTDEHVKILSLLANLTANKIISNRAHSQLQKTVEKLEYSGKIQNILFSIAELIFKTNDLETFFKKLHVILGQLTFTKNFIVALRYNGEMHYSIPFAVDEKDDIHGVANLKIIPEKLSLITHILMNKKSVLLNGSKFDEYVTEHNIKIVGSAPVSWLGVPFGEGNIEGTVIVQCYDDSYQFSQKDLQLLDFVARHVCNAVERLEARQQMHYLALHDSLTGLANRSLFTNQLKKAIQHAKRYPNRTFTLMYLDLDGFKEVNDSYGHHAGDILLKCIAQRLTSEVRDADTISRLGGDEFAVLLFNVDNKEAIYRTANRILEVINLPLDILGHKVQVSTSIGVVSSEGQEYEVNQALSQADEAMYIAKSLGKNQVFYYDDKEAKHFVFSPTFPHHFTQSLEKDHFALYGQPILDLKRNAIIGVEVLVRWFHPEQGLLMPDKFIDNISDSILIEKLDSYIFEKVWQLLKDYRDKLSDSFKINVNMSARGFVSNQIKAQLSQRVKDASFLAKHICLEITEQSITDNVEATQQNIIDFQALGLTIALDDFGTGYSSLNYLHKYNFDSLKIDRSFVSAYQPGCSSSIILESIINLANSLGITVVAEGIETKPQLTTVSTLGCQMGQGYYIGKPVPISELLTECLSKG